MGLFDFDEPEIIVVLSSAQGEEISGIFNPHNLEIPLILREVQSKEESMEHFPQMKNLIVS